MEKRRGGGLPVLAFVAVILALTDPASAIEVCRANALGQIACAGKPTRGLATFEPFRPAKTGLSRVQKPPATQDADDDFIPSTRTNRFGDTLLTEGETPRPRPRICRTDSFDNLRC